MVNKWQNFKAIFWIVVWLFDFITDILTVIYYWRSDIPTNAATLATVLLVLSSPVGFLVTWRMWVVIKKGEKVNEDEWIVVLKCVETLVESIPQLCMNFYVSSVHLCNDQIDSTLGESTVIPPIAVNSSRFSSSTTDMEQIVEEFDITRSDGTGLLILSISGFASGLGIMFAVTYFDSLAKDSFKLNWKIFLFNILIKSSIIISRVYVFAVFFYYFGCQIMLIIIIHMLANMIIMMTNGTADCSMKRSLICFILLIYHLFCWTNDREYLKYTVLGTVIYSFVNIVPLAIVLTTTPSTDGCYFLQLFHLLISAETVISLFIYVIMRRSKKRKKNEMYEVGREEKTNPDIVQEMEESSLDNLSQSRTIPGRSIRRYRLIEIGTFIFTEDIETTQPPLDSPEEETVAPINVIKFGRFGTPRTTFTRHHRTISGNGSIDEFD